MSRVDGLVNGVGNQAAAAAESVVYPASVAKTGAVSANPILKGLADQYGGADIVHLSYEVGQTMYTEERRPGDKRSVVRKIGVSDENYTDRILPIARRVQSIAQKVAAHAMAEQTFSAYAAGTTAIKLVAGRGLSAYRSLYDMSRSAVQSEFNGLFGLKKGRNRVGLSAFDQAGNEEFGLDRVASMVQGEAQRIIVAEMMRKGMVANANQVQAAWNNALAEGDAEQDADIEGTASTPVAANDNPVGEDVEQEEGRSVA